MNKYYKDRYDVIVIGASLAGLSTALSLLDKGYDVLVLEQHNLPGGVATSFVRGGVELEASLHEMLSIGSEKCPLKIRKFLEEHDVKVDWLRVPIAFRYVSSDLDKIVHAGTDGDLTIPSKDIAEACDDKDGSIYNNVLKFLRFCLKIHDEVDLISGQKISKIKMIFKHLDFVKILGYSFEEVMDKYHLPDKAKQLLSAYWMYLGSPINDCPFLVYAYMLSDYLAYGSYIPKHTSFEISLKLAESVMNRGGQIEFSQRVNKILVKDNIITGVKLDDGTIIKSQYVVSGAYPNTVFDKMIEPKKEVPIQAIKTINAMDIGVSCFSIVMLLDKDYQELGIKDYATFYAPKGLDTSKVYDSGKKLEKWEFITSVCANIVDKDITPNGTCFYSITFLPKGESFIDMSIEQYEEYKKKIIDHFLELEGNRLGIDFKKHILEIVIETPITISHYTGAYMGSIYGYRHSMDNHSAAREEMEKDEKFIQGLIFSGAHQTTGDGMSPAITNGIKAARLIIEEDNRKSGDR